MTKRELIETIEKLTERFPDDTIVRFQTENEDLFEPDEYSFSLKIEDSKEILIFNLCEL